MHRGTGSLQFLLCLLELKDGVFDVGTDHTHHLVELSEQGQAIFLLTDTAPRALRSIGRQLRNFFGKTFLQDKCRALGFGAQVVPPRQVVHTRQVVRASEIKDPSEVKRFAINSNHAIVSASHRRVKRVRNTAATAH
jgi:hypothetical protein